MDSEWSGFSAEEIKKAQYLLDIGSPEKKIDDKDTSSPTSSRDKSKPNKNSRKKYVVGKKSLQNENSQIYPIPLEARLNQDRPDSLKGTSNTEDNGSTTSSEMSSSISSKSSTSQNPCDEPVSSVESGIEECQNKPVTILVEENKLYKLIQSPPSDDIPVRSCNDFSGEALTSRPLQKAFLLERENPPTSDSSMSLELFQERQKFMEEQNKRKKELLKKAIADRKRQTQFEAKKLIQIQEELNRLDALLSTDVGILRNQIELASYEFNEAQKRYDKAESEFIEAKMQLFNKLERKELLTEHLCRIIEVNEQRKAKKLSELMAKLEIFDEKSDLSVEDIPPTTPLTANSGGCEIKYKTCSALKLNHQNNLTTESVNSTPLLEGNPKFSSEEADDNSDRAYEPVSKGCKTLQSINLTTAQNLDHRNINAVCDLNEEIEQ